MGKTMAKANVIWGEQHSVSLAGFNSAQMLNIITLIQKNIGPHEAIDRSAADKAINKAKSNTKMKNAYVKVGVIGTDLVLRCKEKKFFGDIEVDAILVKSYPSKKLAWDRQQIQATLDQVQPLPKRPLAQTQRPQPEKQPQSGPVPTVRPTLAKSRSSRKESESGEVEQDLFSKQEQGRIDEKERQMGRLTPEMLRKPSVKGPLAQSGKGEKEQPEKETTELSNSQKGPKKRTLSQVMNTPDEDGVTPRDKILRAAKNAQKLGVGDYAKGKLKAQGLTAMDERYHGEAIDPKNRYGRYMPELRDLWEKHASTIKNFSKWLDDAEARHVDVPGVKEALELRKPKNEGGGPIIELAGVAGGRVLYLDDDARKEYVVTASKGSLTGGKIAGGGEYIFVIGSDSRIYAGKKQRGAAGKLGAFNHSSFFSGGPVRSAGTLKLSGSKIVDINDLSGHYTPTKAMVVTAVRKFAGGDKTWLGEVQVHIGSETMTGAALLDEDHEKFSTDTWSKYSAGTVSRDDAKRVLLAAADGNWLVREGSNKKLVLSFRKGDVVDQALITDIGSKGLDRKNLLLPDQVKDLLKTAPPLVTTQSDGDGQKSKRRSKLPEEPKTSQPQRPTTTTTQKVTSGLPESLINSMKRSPGWHDNINRAGSELLLKDKPNAWLLREGRDGVVAFSVNDAGALKHYLMTDMNAYNVMNTHATRYADLVIRP